MLGRPVGARQRSGTRRMRSPIVEGGLLRWVPGVAHGASSRVIVGVGVSSGLRDAGRRHAGQSAAADGGSPLRPRLYSLLAPRDYCCHGQRHRHPVEVSSRRAAVERRSRRRDALVGRRERQPHVLREAGAVEVAGAGEDAEIGEPPEALPRVAALRRPQVEARLAARRCGSPRPRAPACSSVAPSAVAAPSAPRRARRRRARRPSPTAAAPAA